HDRAEPLFLEVLTLREKVLGADNPDTLMSKNNLGALYRDQAKYDQAEPLLRQAVAGATEKLGYSHPSTQTYHGNLATLYDPWGKPKKVKPLLRQQLDFLRDKAGAESPATAAAMAELSLNLLRQKKHAEAEKHLHDCLRIREKTQPDEWTTFNTRSLLGE